MIIVMRAGATTQEIAAVVDKVERMGFRAHLSQGEERTIVGVIGDERPIDPGVFELMEGVERTVPILRPFKLASRDFHPADSVFSINGVKIGGQQLCIMAGPCAVESRQQILEVAHAVKEAGAHVLRGGAFKPRTSPYSFQGLGLRGLELLAEAREETGLPVVTEVMAPEAVSMVAQYADILQIGTRNMQNFALLQAVGKANVPVLLKRGMMSTIEEFLMSAEYILANGNPRVILCERGIRTFERYTRNTLDINAIPSLKQLTHLPVIADPSQGTGKWDLVAPVSKACIAAGADGLIIEVHPCPEEALSDQAQQIRPEVFAKLMADLKALAPLLGRTL
ncbi:MAG: 3-deoxy-7-phosphoheptulonate synthase [Anaerolineae bacterium]|nr:3-deoxy-7-phosphoheptulonate synthase [Anaerolineae bacterium]MDW8100029.1 3-deoxy-7-phosphoheptulonate synthase [Anaerolineae bacterium]